jgi:hypothetical protein
MASSQRRLSYCHAEFVVVERSPDDSGFYSGKPELNLWGIRFDEKLD